MRIVMRSYACLFHFEYFFVNWLVKKSDNYTLFFLLICSIYYIEEQCK